VRLDAVGPASPGVAAEAGPTDPQPSAAPAGSSWTTLFNEGRFHALNLREGQRIVTAEARDDDGRLIGTLGGVLDGDLLVCGHSAPFGGLDFARERETPANVARLVDDALPCLLAAGARRIRIKLPPACYGDNETLVQFTLLNRGFELERCELNQHVDLQALAGPEDYIRRLKSPARRALRHLLGPEFAFVEARSEGEWDRAYGTLAANRAQKDRALSLSRGYVQRARDALGERVRMFELLHGDRAVAAALVYRVRAGRELVVAWGDGPHELERSPMNLLAYRVIEQALAEGVATLDLGISNDHEPDTGGGLVPNAGLVRFKQSVLAQIEPRMTLVRELAA
jgi:hypothetical protein